MMITNRIQILITQFSFQPSITSWRIIFFVTIGLYIVEIIAYLTLGSGEQQPWNSIEGTDKNAPEATPLREQEHTDYKTKEKNEV